MSKIKLTALSRSVVETDHAVITGDGFVNSKIPGWDNCEVNVIINEAMGANFCQLLITMEAKGKLKGQRRENMSKIRALTSIMSSILLLLSLNNTGTHLHLEL